MNARGKSSLECVSETMTISEFSEFNDLKGPKVKYNLHYKCVRGDFLQSPHGTTPAAVIKDKNEKFRSVKIKEKHS